MHILWGDDKAREVGSIVHADNPKVVRSINDYVVHVETLVKNFSIPSPVHIFLSTENPQAQSQFLSHVQKVHQKAWIIYHYDSAISGQRTPMLEAKRNRGKAGFNSLVALFITLQAKYYVLTTCFQFYCVLLQSRWDFHGSWKESPPVTPARGFPDSVFNFSRCLQSIDSVYQVISCRQREGVSRWQVVNLSLSCVDTSLKMKVDRGINAEFTTFQEKTCSRGDCIVILTQRNFFSEIFKFSVLALFPCICPVRVVAMYALQSAGYIPASDRVRKF